jgi:hypothetical protein
MGAGSELTAASAGSAHRQSKKLAIKGLLN